MSTNDSPTCTFNSEDCRILSQLDSLEFGFFKPGPVESRETCALLERAVLYFDSIIAQTVLELEKERAIEEAEALAEAEYGSREEDVSAIRFRIYKKYTCNLEKLINPKIYILLGHYQLLLHRFDDALSAYRKYEASSPAESAVNCSFLYGLGLCSFRFNAFNKTVSVFQQILYLQPWFPRSKELHIRLGYIYKLQNNFDRSLRHYRQALNDSSPGTFTRIEIRFHIAHLLEVCSKLKQAKTEYRQLLELDKSRTPNHIRHLCLRQLAWLHHTETISSGKTTSDVATDQQRGLDVQWLQTALHLDNTNGRTWYLLGRCQAALNRVQEAFAAYRSSIDKTEASADTWCSIGVLYQEQSQPMDALQAYFCAVQLDKCHVAAWSNLGTLYETMQQYNEALKCYRNAVNADKRNELRPEIRTRLFILQQIVPRLPEKVLSGGLTGPPSNASGNNASSMGSGAAPNTPGAGNNPVTGITKLPTVDEAWNLPIPSELTQRQMQLMLQEANSAVATSGSPAANVMEPDTGGDATRVARRSADRQLAGLLMFTPSRSAMTSTSLLNKSDGGKRRWNSGEISSSLLSDNNSKLEKEPSDECDNKRPRPDEPESASSSAPPLNREQRHMLQTLLTQENTLTASQRQVLNRLQQQALRYHLYRLSCRKSGVSPLDDYETGDTIASPGTSVDETGHPTTENPSSLTGADLFPTDDDDLAVGVTAADNLPEEDFNFLTDDFLAQLNRSEAAGSLDLVEFALFAPNTVSSSSSSAAVTSTGDLQRPPSVETDGIGRIRDRGMTDDVKENQKIDDATQKTDARTTSGDYHDVKAINRCNTTTPGGVSSGVGAGRDHQASPQADSIEPVNLLNYLTRPLNSPENVTSALNINMTSEQILASISGLGRSGGPWWPSLLPEDSPLPCPPAKPYPPPPKEKLLPPTPTVYLENKKDAHAPELMRYCLSQPVVVIRGLSTALRLDLGLFSTKSLVEANPDHRMEVRTQRKYPPDVNLDVHGNPVWFCQSPKTVTTISKYAAYQAGSFIEAMREEKSRLGAPSPLSSPATVAVVSGSTSADSQSVPGDCENVPSLSTANGSVASCHRRDSAPGTVAMDTLPSTDMKPPAHSTVPGQSAARDQGPTAVGAPRGTAGATVTSGRPKVIRFGTNCDLSDEKKWYAQLHELAKLPNFVRVVSAFNMLSHVGYPLLGMNTVQLYLKVPGCRTPGHQENNCFSAININIGPGDCEWFAVPEQYWGAIHDLCERNNVDYLNGSWWPNMETLQQEEIPVYRFIQRPGDLVWINAGTVHWVQAIGWCNNIAWNVGPLTARQYQMALERYEFNRLRDFKSVVPMIHFSWQLARNVKISDPSLYELVKHTLLRSLVQSQMAIDFIEKLGQPIKRHGKRSGDVAHTCHDCEIEVFNLLYVTAQEKKLFVRCLDCARHIDASLRSVNILSEYYMHELAEIYDDFQLQVQPMTAYSVGRT